MTSTQPTWTAKVSARLQLQWPSVDPVRLDDLAEDLWRDEQLRALEPDDAARRWLQPVVGDGLD
jgi:hypothetical protein